MNTTLAIKQLAAIVAQQQEVLVRLAQQINEETEEIEEAPDTIRDLSPTVPPNTPEPEQKEEQKTRPHRSHTHYPAGKKTSRGKGNFNGYVDLTSGGWAVDMYSRKKPEPGDHVVINIVHRDGTLDSKEELITQVLHEEQNWSPRNPSRYLVAIQSQDQVNKLMADMDNPETSWEYR